MYLFSRSARLAVGRTRDAMAWAVGITEKVNQISELEFSLWTPVFSPAVGTLTWTTIATDLEELEAVEAKLMVDDGYVAELDRGATFSDGSGANDALMQVLHGEIDPARRPQYVSVASSVIAAGRLGQGMAVGVELAQLAERLSGMPGSFAADLTGPFGGVAWITPHDDLKQLMAAEQAVYSSPEFVEFIDTKASDAFVAASTTQMIVRRIV